MKQTCHKRDAVERGLVGEIISRFEQRNENQCSTNVVIGPDLAEKHAEHIGDPFMMT